MARQQGHLLKKGISGWQVIASLTRTRKRSRPKVKVIRQAVWSPAFHPRLSAQIQYTSTEPILKSWLILHWRFLQYNWILPPVSLSRKMRSIRCTYTLYRLAGPGYTMTSIKCMHTLNELAETCSLVHACRRNFHVCKETCEIHTHTLSLSFGLAHTSTI